MNDSLYNPDSMSKEDIKTLFVARQPLLDELVSTIRNQPQGAGVQHLLIIAPRGMGKTTMLLMLQFAAEDDKELSKNWQAVRFPEESYGITELADFWLKVLQYLADATNDEDFETKIEEIESRFTKSEDLREAAWALVKDWSKKHKKRILLLVDNFNMILDQIGNDTEQARLRDILMNDGTIMFIGGAPSYFHQIQNYEQPLYNFFKIHNLSDLKFADIEDLLRRRAELDEIENIEELLQKNRSRIKALETFTSGNPRLVLMLYRIIISSDMTEVTKGLESLLDAVTPLYKDKTEQLPAQQRKIINEIAQYSLEKRGGISPTEIAQRIRMTPNQVSSQLKRLAENGYVKSLNIRGRSSFYVLSEPLYAIWAQMRFGRNAREKRNWLVQILKALFDVQEIQKEIEKLGERIKNFKLGGRENKARGTLEYMICLLETHPTLVVNNFPLAIESYLELDEISSLKAEVKLEKLSELPKGLLSKLVDKKVISKEEAVSHLQKNVVEISQQILESVIKYIEEVGSSEALLLIDDICKVSENTIKANNNKYIKINLLFLYKIKRDILISLKEFHKAFIENEKAINLVNELPEKPVIIKQKSGLYFQKAYFLLNENRIEEASQTINQIIMLEKESNPEYWLMSLFAMVLVIFEEFGDEKVKKILNLSNLEEELFPFVRALEYLETKNEGLIEKLSPEVRIVVEETIRTLQMVMERKPELESKQKVKIKKDRKSENSKSLVLSK